ncbi:MAG: hypothetical protein QG622_845 [Actinomycetota bacterium]|nr:hypothetical protein [Actinomycetota bacterium]
MTIRVVVADDQPLIREGLSGIIATAPDMRIVGEAANGAEAIELVAREQPDAVLMDIRMPGMDGIEATRIVTTGGGTRVLILTTFDLDEYVYGALRAGASGFLLKDASPAHLLDAVRVVAAGDALLAPSVTRRLITKFAGTPGTTEGTVPGGTGPEPSDELRARITERELEVLLLVAEGLSNSEIGHRLHITPGTVKTHVAHLLTKLDARDRLQLVIFTFRAGLA